MDFLKPSKDVMNNILKHFVDINFDTRPRGITLVCLQPMSFNPTPQGNHNPDFLFTNLMDFISFISYLYLNQHKIILHDLNFYVNGLAMQTTNSRFSPLSFLLVYIFQCLISTIYLTILPFDRFALFSNFCYFTQYILLHASWCSFIRVSLEYKTTVKLLCHP